MDTDSVMRSSSAISTASRSGMTRRSKNSSRPAAAARQLPGVGAREMTELADQQHVPAIHKRHHAHGEPHVQHGIGALPAGGQPPHVLAQREPAHRAKGGGAQELPVKGHGRALLARNLT